MAEEFSCILLAATAILFICSACSDDWYTGKDEDDKEYSFSLKGYCDLNDPSLDVKCYDYTSCVSKFDGEFISKYSVPNYDTIYYNLLFGGSTATLALLLSLNLTSERKKSDDCLAYGSIACSALVTTSISFTCASIVCVYVSKIASKYLNDVNVTFKSGYILAWCGIGTCIIAIICTCCEYINWRDKVKEALEKKKASYGSYGSLVSGPNPSASNGPNPSASNGPNPSTT